MPSEQPFWVRIPSSTEFSAYRIREAGTRVPISAIEITYADSAIVGPGVPTWTTTLNRTPYLPEYRTVSDGTTSHIGTDLPANSFVCFIIESHYGSRAGIFGGGGDILTEDPPGTFTLTGSTSLGAFNVVSGLFPQGQAGAYILDLSGQDPWINLACNMPVADSGSDGVVVHGEGFYTNGLYSVPDNLIRTGGIDGFLPGTPTGRAAHAKSSMCIRWRVGGAVGMWSEYYGSAGNSSDLEDHGAFGYAALRGFDLQKNNSSRPRLDPLAGIFAGIDDTYCDANKPIVPTGIRIGYQSRIIECDSTADITAEMECIEWAIQSGSVVVAVPDGTHIQMGATYQASGGLFDGDVVAPPAIPSGSGDTLPVITDTEPDRAIDSAWSYTIDASNTPTVWGLSGGPAWMSIAGNVVSGTPDSVIFPTFYRFTVYAGNSVGIAKLTLIMTVTPAGFTLNFVGGPASGGSPSVDIGCSATYKTTSLDVACS